MTPEEEVRLACLHEAAMVPDATKKIVDLAREFAEFVLGVAPAKPVSYFKWTPERHEKLREMTAAGFTARQIAAHLGVSKNAIDNQRQKLGLTNMSEAQLRVVTARGKWGGRPRRNAAQ